MRDRNKVYGCISSSNEGYSVYFRNREDIDKFNLEYLKLVTKYNLIYDYGESYGTKKDIK